MNLLSTSILSAVSTIVRMLCGVIITKVIAVFSGPAGLAMIGQLQSFINITMLVTGDFLKTAITKYTAEYRDDDRKFRIWSASIRVTLTLCVVICPSIYFFSEEISLFIMNDESFSFVLKVFSLTLPFYVLNSIFLSILNGCGKISKFIFLNITLSLASLILVCVLSYYSGLSGALTAYVTNQSLVLVVTIGLISKEPWFKTKYFKYQHEFGEYTKLFKYALITIASILSSNGSLFFIRSYLIEHVSDVTAGHWQAIWSLSQLALSLITTSLVTYLLPKLSRIKGKVNIDNELKSAFKLVLPLTIFISFSMYLLRDVIVSVLYTKDFYPVRDLFFWQLVGNCIKVCGWLFGYVLVARAGVKYTVSTEIIFAMIWCSLTVILVNNFGVIGAIYAYVINASLHFFVMATIYKYKVE